MATLAVYRGDQLLRQVELGEGRTRIGRSPENELVLEDRDKGVSRTHAEIRYERGQYVVVDLNSQNGVWIGERRVKTDPLPVDGPVTIGPYRLLLVTDPQLPQPVDGPGTLIPAEGEERFAEPTELVQKAAQAARTQVAAVRAPWLQKRALIAILAGVAVMVIVVAIVRRPAPPEPTPVVTSEPAPAPEQIAEQQFQDHYGKAQGYIEKGDKASAGTENAEALKVLPSDPRGLKQQTDIEAMIESPSTEEIPDNPPVNPTAGTAPAPAPPVATTPSTLRVTARPGENASQRNSREKIARTHLDDGKKALSERRYAEAIEYLQAALDNSDRADYGYTADEASSLLRSAKVSKGAIDGTQKRAAALKLVEQAKASAGSDIVSAVQKLREARTLDSQVPGAAELLNTLQEQAAAQGESALSRAKNFDRFKRTDEAIKEFDKAVALLELVPGGHKDLPFAKQRVTELKAPR